MNYLDLVQELNYDLWEEFQEDFYQFSYSSNGTVDLIKFEGLVLWCSEDDDREFFEDINDYEPIKPFIQKKYNDLIDRFYSFKIHSDSGWINIEDSAPKEGDSIYYEGNCGAVAATFKGIDDNMCGVAELENGSIDVFDKWRKR